jgi:3-oxoacyl-(acyl-carrier-protein) synthase
MINIHGIGWINKNEYGCIMKDLRVRYEGDTEFDRLAKAGVFSYPFKNFGRLNKISKLTGYAVALALKDAGVNYSPDKKQDIGIIGTSDSGSLQADIFYFKDYLDCGRILGRGNLFIYTLPSSPLGEAVIHFGLQGPLFYTAAPEKSLLTLITMASQMIHFNETNAMLAGINSEQKAVYFVLMKDSVSGNDPLSDRSNMRAILGKNLTISKMIKEFLKLRKEKK